MENKKLSEKVEPFLLEVYNELVINKNRKLRIRQLLIKHKLSDSAREALFVGKILSKDSYGSGAVYEWITYLPSNELYSHYLETIKEIHRKYNKKRYSKSEAKNGTSDTLQLENKKVKIPILLPMIATGLLIMFGKSLIKKCL